MIDTIEAEDAWCPPTLIASTFSLRWLALWIIQCDSHKRRCSTVFNSAGVMKPVFPSTHGLPRIAPDPEAWLSSPDHIRGSPAISPPLAPLLAPPPHARPRPHSRAQRATTRHRVNCRP